METDQAIVTRLRAAGCVFAEEEAAILRSSADTAAELSAMVARRVAGEPLEQVVGWAEFAGLRVLVDPGVFVPRRRSEFLVEVAIGLAHRQDGAVPRVVVDLCCGTGALGLAVAAGLANTRLTRTGLTRTGLTGTGLTGTGLTGTGLTGTGLTGTGLTGTGLTGTGLTGTGLTSTGLTSTGLTSTGLTRTGLTSTGPANTGPANTGAANTGAANTGGPANGVEAAPTSGVSPADIRLADVELHAADLDPAAVECARRNVDPPGGHVYAGDLFAALPSSLRSRIGVLICNAPYVPTAEIGFLPAEARVHEAPLALNGGPDGLAVLRRAADEAPTWLAPGGVLIVETSERQAPSMAEVMTAAGLAAGIHEDDESGATVVTGVAPGDPTTPRPDGVG